MRVTMPSFLTADASPEQRIGQRSSMLEYDQSLVWVTTLLLLLGMVMVYSASVSLPDSPKYAGYKNHHFLARQAGFIAFGLITGLLAFRVRIEQWERWTPWLFLGAIGLSASTWILRPYLFEPYIRQLPVKSHAGTEVLADGLRRGVANADDIQIAVDRLLNKMLDTHTECQ